MERTKYNDGTKQVMMQAITGVKEVYKEATTYNADTPRMAYHMSKYGLNYGQIAEVLGVNEFTVGKWLNSHPDFAMAVHEGRAIIDAKVEASFLQCCLGYEREELVTTSYKGKFNSMVVTKTYPPDGYLCARWLAVRQPKLWANVQKVDVQKTINITNNIDATDITNDELAMLETIGIKQLSAASKPT